ncbi:tetratricopeptide repeat protein [Paenibacillus sp. 481]|uniref:tetratricopeptide repeat protein n=1 Tax=Paenibacillus sp. 481 TaxID=2835869 RepID=UPI001E4FE10B|nr:tetratricopeptide repeat protein [Paenibacillus sp. 481]UHA75214.1 tetratricopeptide repeat protein [Paenibacillus sp. 481]
MAEQTPQRTGKDMSRSSLNLVLFPVDADAYSERAVKSLDRLHYDKALKYFRKAVECEPNDPIHQCNLAGALAETGKFDESNDILEHVLDELDPMMVECYYYMANNFAYLGEFDTAEAMLNMYITLDGNGQFAQEAEEMLEMIHYEMNHPLMPNKRERGIKQFNLKEGRAAYQAVDGEEDEQVDDASAVDPSSHADEAPSSEQNHEAARKLLEAGQFIEAEAILLRAIEQDPDFLAARNNLALAYYYMGRFPEACKAVEGVLERDSGNLHALCNFAVFQRQANNEDVVADIVKVLCKIEAFHHEHIFKLATTMGMLDEHAEAYRHLRRLLVKESLREPSLHHYAAVAACHMGRLDEAAKWWAKCRRLDPDSGIATYFLEQLQRGEIGDAYPMPSYQYRLPNEELSQLHATASGAEVESEEALEAKLQAKIRMFRAKNSVPESMQQTTSPNANVAEAEGGALEREGSTSLAAEAGQPSVAMLSATEERLKSDPIVRSSLFWALRFGDEAAKMHALQAMLLLGDEEAKQALRGLLLDPEQDAYLKQVAVYVLRSLGVNDPLEASWNGEHITVTSNHIANQLPTWEVAWQEVLSTLRLHMNGRYDLFQMHDAETLWIEFITRLYPADIPKLTKTASWAAAVEYLSAKLHQQPVSYQEVADRYEASVSTISKHAKRIEETCQVEARLKCKLPLGGETQ